MKKYKRLLIIILVTFSSIYFLGCEAATQSVKILHEDEVKNEIEYESMNISLTDSQLERYQKYADTENEQLLKELSPMDIFKYYYHAFKIEDYKTLYGLYIKGETYKIPSWKEFSDDIKNKKILHMVLLDRVEYNVKSLAQIKYDDQTTYIKVNFKNETDLTKKENWNFKLIKNSQDIWKLEWLPLK